MARMVSMQVQVGSILVWGGWSGTAVRAIRGTGLRERDHHHMYRCLPGQYSKKCRLSGIILELQCVKITTAGMSSLKHRIQSQNPTNFNTVSNHQHYLVTIDIRGSGMC